ncbi:MAG: ROK family protein [Mesorhizobium sp.]|uniref:ROK family transcriptional regulator n=2 Tax=Mesorhizobium TaxID=68287 RepID=UPI000F7622D8|nr:MULTISPECIES: ROK family transcriptional regulator [unclassified Mesorhizobium]RUX98907.1 ROK family protein [Mesorhizobium sp. M2A.F.Ca.ET.040.01.1.1]RVC62014.1 ROK family protein [Mesorhizobium sp. M00.F.Ca.ET.038.03.1.1]AZO37101.1 ROK family transcriptional regulator [Mesorhizobium sp. M2A.F.Ca.ET.046.03.2.1]RWA92039.1 MAG: ROK family protein [Mesorhizobium sp.]RWB43087.1 MAG: ROK family protein [Mesorhizobium sp.]
MHDISPIRAKSGTNQEGTSAHNRRVMIEALRLNGALSRADLARATQLTKQAVSNIIEDLERDGLVVALEAVRKGRGQPFTPYRLVPEGAFAIGLQIDRHLTRVVVVDLVGKVIARAEAGLPLDEPSAGVKTILGLVDRVRRELASLFAQPERRLVGLGVAMPGPFGVRESDDTWMMPAWQQFPLLETLAAGTGLNVGLQNDAAACATAERIVGAAHGVDHAVCLYVGYGIAAGLILNGELYNGGSGNAGEIGRALLSPAGPGSTPLEHRASLASLYQHLGLDPAERGLYEKLGALALAQDARVMSWVERAASDLRWSVHLIETIFDPQTVILTSTAPEALARLLHQAMHPLLPSIADQPARRLPRLQLGTTDPWAIAVGAAAEPISRAFDPRFSAILKAG